MIIEILKRQDRSIQNARIDYVIGVNGQEKLEDVTYIGGSVLSESPIVHAVSKAIDDNRLARLKDEMSLANNFNIRAKKTSDHFVISLSKGESLCDQHWKVVAENYLEQMGYESCKWFCVKHQDSKCEHLHIIVNNLSFDEDKQKYLQVKNNNNHHKSMKARLAIEQALIESSLNIKPAPTEKSNDAQKLSFSKKSKRIRKVINDLKAAFSMLEKEEQAKQQPIVKQEIETLNNSIRCDTNYLSAETALVSKLEDAKAFALTQSKPAVSFIRLIRAQQISPKLYFKQSKAGGRRITGVSFLYQGQLFKGSKLAQQYLNDGFYRPYSAKSLFTRKQASQKALLYADNDLPLLDKLSNRNENVKCDLKGLNHHQKAEYNYPLKDDELFTLQAHLKAKEQTQAKLQRESNISNTPFLVTVSLSPHFYQKLETLVQQANYYKCDKALQHNFLLYKKVDKHCIAFYFQNDFNNEQLKLTYEEFLEKSIDEQQALAKAFVELVLKLVKLFLALIQRMLGLPQYEEVAIGEQLDNQHIQTLDVHLDTSPSELAANNGLDDEAINQKLANLNPLNISTISSENPRQLSAAFIELLHRINSKQLIGFYNDKPSKTSLEAIGIMAKHVIQTQSSNLTEKEKAKRMMFLLVNHFPFIEDPTFENKFHKGLTPKDAKQAIDLVFDSDDSYFLGREFKYDRAEYEQYVPKSFLGTMTLDK